jgi:hypothetical protein
MHKTSTYVGCSLMIRLDDERSIATTSAALRDVSRAVLTYGRTAELLAFRCEANRVRLVTACDEAQAKELARRVKVRLRVLIGPKVGFARMILEVLGDVWQLQRAFKSVLKRSAWVERVDPYQEGSNLIDLLGLRVTGAYTWHNVQSQLQRIQPSFLLDRLGVGDLGAGDLPLAWHTLGESTLATVAATDLRKRSLELAAAKRAAVHVVASTLRTEAISGLLHLRPRRVRELRAVAEETLDPDLVQAIILQLQLRAALAPRPGQS